MFSQVEIRFLSQEHATAGLRAFPEVDFTTLKTNRETSLRSLQRIFETRAARLGKTWDKFRASLAEETPAKASDAAELKEKLHAARL